MYDYDLWQTTEWQRANGFASKGDKVTFKANGGYDGDIQRAKDAGLVIGQSYVITKTEIGRSSSDYTLEGFDKSFNTVMFERTPDPKAIIKCVVTEIGQDTIRGDYNAEDFANLLRKAADEILSPNNNHYDYEFTFKNGDCIYKVTAKK